MTSVDAILPDKIRRGRTSRWKFTQTPQWALLMTELSDPGYRIYSLLLAHVNITDDDGEVWPQQQTMAEMLDRHRNSISRVVTKELIPLGLADVEVERYGTNNSRRRNIYTVHELPPDGFDGWASIAEWYDAHPRPEPAPTNRRDRKNAGQPGRTKNGASGRTADGAVTRRRKNKTKEETSSPLPPSFQRGSDVAQVGREDDHTQEHKDSVNDPHMERAQVLLDDAVRLWAKGHKAPTGRSRQRLSERIAAELANGGDETVIVHELTRDMSDIGNAVAVMVKDRTSIPGWGVASDPRPDHSQYEIRTKTPWCGHGACDEHTRLANVYDDRTGETRPAQCRAPVTDPVTGETVACHPRAIPRRPEPEDDPEAEEMGPDEFAAASYASLRGTDRVHTHASAVRDLLAKKKAEKEAREAEEAAAKAAAKKVLPGIVNAADREKTSRHLTA